MAQPSLSLAPDAAPAPTPGRRLALVRGLTLLLSVVLIGEAQRWFTSVPAAHTGWWLALAAAIVAIGWQYGLVITAWRQPDGRQWTMAPQWWRWLVGGAIALAGAALWWNATVLLSASFAGHFDRSWLSWVAAAAVMSLGLRIMQAPRAPARNRLSRWEWGVLIAVIAAAAVCRLANFHNFPPNDAVSQVEELQVGSFATDFLKGARGRWEFLPQAWVGAVGIWLGGPSLRSIRLPFSVVSLLKIAPAYFWFRALAGPAGAMAGTGLLAVSGWDTIVARIPGHPDGLVAVCCLALLMGPAVRGLWAVYPWIGLMAGYSTYTYIAFRPLVIFALVGVVIANLARPATRRWLPPLRAVAALLLVGSMVAGMFIPLTHRLEGRFANEYFNGWNRARAVAPYYDSNDSWTVALDKRWYRTATAVGLLYTIGDTNPTHNAKGRALVDPVTGSLLLFGIGCCLWLWRSGFYGLVLAAFGITFTGTLIATGNFDVLRAQAAITYVYALAAIGAGGVYAAADRFIGRPGRLGAAVALAAGVLWGGYWNGSLLHDLWTSPETRQHYRNDLAYLSDWLRQNASGQRVIALIPSSAIVALRTNDASWLRGPDVHGESFWDVHQTLDKLATQQDQVMFLIGSSGAIPDLVDYFEYRLPGLHMEIRTDEFSGVPRVAYGSLDSPAPLVNSPMGRQSDCRGVRAEFVLRRADGSAIVTFTDILPFIDPATWPGAVRNAVHQYETEARSITVTWQADFAAPEPGRYAFLPREYEGGVTAYIDGVLLPDGSVRTLTLAPGIHHFQMQGRFNARIMEPSAALAWNGPITHGQLRAFPFYRLAEPDQECLARLASQTHGSGGGPHAPAGRPLG
jgi:hypothetical protein